jgi:hypothetical protein
MSTIVLRSVKNAPLTNAEVDANFTNLNNDKTELGGTYSSGTANGVLFLSSSKVLTTGSALTFDGTSLKATGKIRANNAGVPTADVGFVTLNGYQGTSSANGGFAIVPTTGGGAEFYTHTGAVGSESYTEQMRLTSTGLGIGTSSPNGRLTLQNTSVRTEFGETSGSNYIESLNNARTATAGLRMYGSEFKVFTGASGSYGDRLTIDSSGNLGLGVTPSANDYTGVAQFKWVGHGLTPRTESNFALSMNAYHNAGGWKYGGTAAASAYIQASGAHQFFTAPSWDGTGSNAISFTQAMTLDASGRLGIGTTSPSFTLVVASADPAIQVKRGALNGILINQFDGTGNSSINLVDNAALIFGTNNTERARIDSSGRLLVGTANSGGNKLAISDGGTDTSSYGSVQVVRAAAGGTVWHYAGVANGVDIGGFGFNSSNAAIFGQGGSPNSASAYIAAGLIGGSNNLVFATSASERARIDSSGNLLVGTTVTDPIGSRVDGYAFYKPDNAIRIRGSNGVANIGLNASTGVSIQFFTDNGSAAVGAGNISSNGSTTTYNTSSDYRLKNVIGAVSGAGERIDALEPIEYEWKADGSRTRGFLAHQFQEVYASSVSGTKDAVDADGKPVYQSMQAGSSEVIADLVAEIQSLRARLAAANI